MSQQITCPHCHQSYDMSAVLTKDIERHLKQGLQKELSAKEEKLRQQEADFETKKKNENQLFKAKLEEEKKKMQEGLKKEAAAEQFEKLKVAEDKLAQEQEKRKALQKIEIEKMQLEKKLAELDEENELAMRKREIELETELKEKISKEILGREREKFDMEKRILEKQLEDQKKLTREMQKKQEQGSMQTQGEVMELAIEEILQREFPFDQVDEVKKGQHGADCILMVNNNKGQVCGKIVLESKNAENYSNAWIPKLKSDMQKAQGDVAILVTKKMPNDISVFDMIDSVWVCRMHEMVSLVRAIRENIINIDRMKQGQENKGEKKEMLYNYFISNEFRQHVRAINDAYMTLKMGVQEEKNKMEKIWKAREKQIDKILLNNNHLIGSIEGITGEELDGNRSIEVE